MALNHFAKERSSRLDLQKQLKRTSVVSVLAQKSSFCNEIDWTNRKYRFWYPVQVSSFFDLGYYLYIPYKTVIFDMLSIKSLEGTVLD